MNSEKPSIAKNDPTLGSKEISFFAYVAKILQKHKDKQSEAFHEKKDLTKLLWINDSLYYLNMIKNTLCGVWSKKEYVDKYLF